jgi:hypothetical protein
MKFFLIYYLTSITWSYLTLISNYVKAKRIIVEDAYVNDIFKELVMILNIKERILDNGLVKIQVFITSTLAFLVASPFIFLLPFFLN